MPASLVVVDSRPRAHTLQALIGEDALVLACPGEIRELEPEAERVAPAEPGFRWLASAQRELRELKAAAASAQRVFLATDPDPEGELRAWHLAEALAPRPVARLRLVETTRDALHRALEDPSAIDAGLVQAELTRRLAHRLVASALEADRGSGPELDWPACLVLQRAAEREAALAAYRPPPGHAVVARLETPGKLLLEVEAGEGLAEAEASALCAELEAARWTLTAVLSRKPPAAVEPGLDTAGLVRAAERQLRFPAARTLAIARRLYDGKRDGGDASVGLITYPLRAETAVERAVLEAERRRLEAELGRAALRPRPLAGRGRPGIRPTDPARHPDAIAAHLARDEGALYDLVWRHFRAALLQPPRARGARLRVTAGRHELTFTWPGREGEARPEGIGLRRGTPLVLRELIRRPAAGRPPERYTEAELLAEMTALGICTPDELTALVSRLEEATLLVRRGVDLHPTRQGQRQLERVGALLPQLLDTSMAARFARDLAAVAAGRRGRPAVLAPFERWLRGDMRAPAPRAAPERRRAPRGPGLRCPECGRGRIVERMGRNAALPFFACDRFPDCTFRSAARPVSGPCPECGAPLLRARARRTFCPEPGCGYARRTADAGA